MVANYGLLVGRPTQEHRALSDHDHYQILIEVGASKYRAAVDVHSKIYPSAVEFAVNENYTFNVDLLKDLAPGVYSNNDHPNLNLDYVRQNLFDKSTMKALPIFGATDGDDLDDMLDKYIDSVQEDPNALLYVFGQLFQDTKPDPVFHFNPGKGIHDIHMNQGNVGNFTDDDGVYQDGGIIIHFTKPDKWVGLFLKFQSQSWDTDANGARKKAQPVAAGYFTND